MRAGHQIVQKAFEGDLFPRGHIFVFHDNGLSHLKNSNGHILKIREKMNEIEKFSKFNFFISMIYFFSFRYGDIIHVTNATDPEWWQARLLVSSNFCKNSHVGHMFRETFKIFGIRPL